MVINWFAPRRAVGRAVVLTGDLMVAMSGAMLTNETLEAGCLSEWLPPRTFGRSTMLVLTLMVAIGWLFCALAVVTRIDMEHTGMVAWFVAVWGMPVLAGVMVLGLWYYRFNGLASRRGGRSWARSLAQPDSPCGNSSYVAGRNGTSTRVSGLKAVQS
jgi:hypothetical protein